MSDIETAIVGDTKTPYSQGRPYICAKNGVINCFMPDGTEVRTYDASDRRNARLATEWLQGVEDTLKWMRDKGGP